MNRDINTMTPIERKRFKDTHVRCRDCESLSGFDILIKSEQIYLDTEGVDSLHCPECFSDNLYSLYDFEYQDLNTK